MNRRRLFIISASVLAVAVVFFVITSAAQAAPEGLVPSGCQKGCPCTICNFYTLGRNILNFLLKGMVVPITAAMFLYGGVLMLTSGASEERIKQGRNAIRDAIIGLGLAFLSYAIINVILGTLAFGIGKAASPNNWFTPLPGCEVDTSQSCTLFQGTPVGGVVGVPPGPPPGGDTGPILTDQQARDLLDDNISVVSSGNCSDPANPSCTSLVGIPIQAIDGANRIARECGCTVRITGGTEIGHLEHGPGKAILDFDNNPTLLNYLTANHYNFINEGDHYHVRF